MLLNTFNSLSHLLVTNGGEGQTKSNRCQVKNFFKYCRRSLIFPLTTVQCCGECIVMCTIYYVLIEIEIVTVLYSLRVNAHCTGSRRQVWRHLPHAVSCKHRPPGHVTRAHAGCRQARAEIRLLVADTIQPVVAFASNPRDGQIVYTSVFRASDCSNNFTCIIEKYVTGFDDLSQNPLPYHKCHL